MVCSPLTVWLIVEQGKLLELAKSSQCLRESLLLEATERFQVSMKHGPVFWKCVLPVRNRDR